MLPSATPCGRQEKMSLRIVTRRTRVFLVKTEAKSSLDRALWNGWDPSFFVHLATKASHFRFQDVMKSSLEDALATGRADSG